MVDVSEKFRQLATDNGRHVYCKIEVGSELFCDDRILEFTMDDVTHPDWFTVGTACANRFHFRALYNGELAVGEMVRPYISFDNEEWCCLGMFYISRRYVRGSIINITAYDRMYSLDSEFETALSLPCTSAALLEEICAAEGIELTDSGYPFEVEKLPSEPCTTRDMIGYIAGLNRACAKFDRSGRLLLKKCSQYEEHISYLNCMDIQRNMTLSHINCLKTDTESETLTAGEGSEIYTVEMYNPLMTQKILDDMQSVFKTFSFYGADIEMQGLPYLESGECMYLLDGALLYPIVISEMELYYNGALTGTIYSRNKSAVDAVIHEDDLEEALKRLSACAYKQTNSAQIAVAEAPVTIAEFSFKAANCSFAELDINISASENTADFVSFRVRLNDVDVGRSIVHNMEQNTGRHLLHIDHLETGLRGGENKLSVSAQTGNGSCYILPDAMQASLVVHGGNKEPDGSGGGGTPSPLVTYEILSDTSVKCNDKTYTVEYGADGLISKITDESGGSIIPTASASVADTAYHNAILWAVAMARGLQYHEAVMDIFNHGTVTGFNPACADFYYNNQLDGVIHSNTFGTNYQETSSITDDAINLRLVIALNYTTPHCWFALANPILNANFRKLCVTFEVSNVKGSYNTSHIVVGRSLDPAAVGVNYQIGITDIVNEVYPTLYGSEETDISVPLTTLELDISSSIGEQIYIGLHHCCNDFIIHSMWLEE